MGFGVYMFFATMMILAAIFVFFLVPETKAIPLESMERLFSGGLPARKAHAVVLAEVREHDRQFRRDSLAEISDGSGSGKVNELGYNVDEKHVERV